MPYLSCQYTKNTLLDLPPSVILYCLFCLIKCRETVRPTGLIIMHTYKDACVPNNKMKVFTLKISNQLRPFLDYCFLSSCFILWPSPDARCQMPEVFYACGLVKATGLFSSSSQCYLNILISNVANINCLVPLYMELKSVRQSLFYIYITDVKTLASCGS